MDEGQLLPLYRQMKWPLGIDHPSSLDAEDQEDATRLGVPEEKSAYSGVPERRDSGTTWDDHTYTDRAETPLNKQPEEDDSLSEGKLTWPVRRRATTIEQQAYKDVLSALKDIGITNLDGMCLEASCLLCAAIRSCGQKATLIRRWSDEFGGHWSVKTPKGEFDPTIAYWDNAPANAIKGHLYKVTKNSPHANWERDSSASETEALLVAEIELGGTMLDLLYGESQ
jgi:hypothetical protein